jgi:hypothetical protein
MTVDKYEQYRLTSRGCFNLLMALIAGAIWTHFSKMYGDVDDISLFFSTIFLYYCSKEAIYYWRIAFAWMTGRLSVGN